MADEPDYYAVLEVAPDADEAAIRLAFRRLARRYHPDVAGTGSAARMRLINVAYETLSDPERRRAYDAQRQPQKRQPPDLASVWTREEPVPPPTGSASTTAPRRGPRVATLQASSGPLRRVATLQQRDETPIAALAFARDGAQVGAGLLDGRIALWDVASAHTITTLSFGAQKTAGVLQELRLSPTGAYAVAWGFQLGTRVWSVADGRTLWNTSMNGPSGTIDAGLFDAPPLIRIALPDAPLALADDDPFRWAHDGRSGSAVLSRPLVGPISPAWAVP
jgi:hypothetical protein